MENFNKVYLLAGGNLNKTSVTYEKLFFLLESSIGRIIEKSNFYESEAWGFASTNNFINIALLVHTYLSPDEVFAKLQSIEKQLGRISKTNNKAYSDRIMDVDIIFFNDNIVETENLTIPHPHMHERMFVLMPLCEITPDFVHPVSGKTIQELKDECKDTLWIQKLICFSEEN